MASQVRHRNAATTKQSPSSSDPTSASAKKSDSSSWSILEILRVLFALILLAGGLSWMITGDSVIFNWRRLPTLVGQAQRYLRGPVHLTDDELKAYDGSDPRLPIYVGLNGSIYDVSASPQTYGPGGSYSFFTGRDATRAFLTGCFKEDLTPDLRGVEEMYIPTDEPEDVAHLTKQQVKMQRERDVRLARKQMQGTIGHWAQVFEGATGRPYFKVGEIVREEGWLERLPRRELCDAAKEGRQKRRDIEAMADKKPPYP